MRYYIISFIVFSTIAIPVFIYSSMNNNVPTFDKVEIKNNWQFRQFGHSEWMIANVPGTVHTDLITNKKIEDPFYRDNEQKQFWVEGEDWEYKTEIDIEHEIFDRENIEVVFEGLDTYADVYVNDKLVKSTDNMFVKYIFPVKSFLVLGKNKLRILFHSPTNIGLRKLNESPYLVPAVNEYAPTDKRTSVFSRKAPFHYGWDWGPRIVTSGIWKPCYLQTWNKAKISTVFHQLTKLYSHEADYETEVELEANDRGKGTLELKIDGKVLAENTIQFKPGISKYKLKFKIANPKLWWPIGAGNQPLYSAEVNLKLEDNIVQSFTKKIGVRTIELVQEPDSVGKSFKFRINGKDIFIKGSNYIPTDNLLTRVDKDRYEKVIKATTDANMNMLRVWGGAIYENDEFYDLCDERGVLVWQDFMFACAMSPGDDKHLENLQSEFTDNVTRLRQHPSIALWCGNNENMVAWFGWDLQKKFKLTAPDSTDLMMTYMKIFYEMIPNTIKKLDSTRSYWPSSPSGGYKYNDFQSTKSGDVHDWWIWFGKATGKDITSRKQRFISEYGLQSYPEMKTINSFTTPEDRQYDSKLFDLKQRSEMPWIGNDETGNVFNGNDMIAWYINNSYKKPSNFENFVYLSQLVQAEELKSSIEGHRSHKPYCWGTMYWQIDDCWPTVSWSTIDYYFRWKAAHYFIKKAYQDITIMPIIKDNSIYVKILSDRFQDSNLSINYIAMDFNGTILAQGEEKFTAIQNTSKTYMVKYFPEVLLKNNPKKSLVYFALKEGDKIIAQNILYFDTIKNLDLPKPNITTKVSFIDNGVQLELSTDKIAKNLYLNNDQIEGFFSDNYFDLLPNIPVKVTFTSYEILKDFEKGLKIKTITDTY